MSRRRRHGRPQGGVHRILTRQRDRPIHRSSHPRLLRAAALDDIRVRPLIHLYGPGHSRRPIFVQFARNLRDRILAQGLMRDSEFVEALAELERHLDDPTTLVVWPYFQAWAKKPQ